LAQDASACRDRPVFRTSTIWHQPVVTTVDMPTMSSIIKGFGTPQVSNKICRQCPTGPQDKAACGRQPDEVSTDHGSPRLDLSDNEASWSSGSVTHEVHPAMCSFLGPQPVSRRSALQQMGQEVLGNMSAVLPAAASRRKKAKAAAKKLMPPMPVKSPLAQAQANAALMAQPQAPPQPVAARMAPPQPTAPRVAALEPAASRVPMKDTPRYHATLTQEPGIPWKVGTCASFYLDLATPLSNTLDPELPAKKRPIFEPGQDTPVAFDRNSPLKKRVTEYLVKQEPSYVGGF